MQDPSQNSKTSLAQLIREQTWNIFRERYKSKFKQQFTAQTFTVLASLTLINKQNGARKTVSVGFGTKSLPNSLLHENPAQDLLADMHAEMLAIRGFWRFLLKQAEREDSEYLERDQRRKKFKLADRYSVYLYCSEIFCGGCCINAKQQSFSGAKPLKYFKADKYPQLKYEPNILRTKPGRMDLLVNKRSAILSCSDLIALFNLVGIQGPKLFSSFIPIFIHTIIVQSQQTMRDNIASGIDFVKRLNILRNRSENLVERQIFNIVIDKKQKRMSSQFKRNTPNLIILQKPASYGSRNQEGFQLCGIMTESQQEWINGKSGLPEGASLKTYKTKGKTSSFCDSKLAADFPIFRIGEDSFKFEAVEYRLKVLFGEWVDDIQKRV